LNRVQVEFRDFRGSYEKYLLRQRLA